MKGPVALQWLRQWLQLISYIFSAISRRISPILYAIAGLRGPESDTSDKLEWYIEASCGGPLQPACPTGLLADTACMGERRKRGKHSWVWARLGTGIALIPEIGCGAAPGLAGLASLGFPRFIPCTWIAFSPPAPPRTGDGFTTPNAQGLIYQIALLYANSNGATFFPIANF